MCQNHETLFEGLAALDIPHTDEQELFKHKKKFDFVTKFAEDVVFRDTEKTICIGTHIVSSVSK